MNHIIWKRLLKSSSPTAKSAVPSSPVNNVPNGHICTSSTCDFTAFPDSTFQSLATLAMKKFIVMYTLNLPQYGLRPFPLVLLLTAWEKRPNPTLLQPSFRRL